MNTNLMDVMVTTFPGHKSQNVGDNMITVSALKMVQSRNPNYNPTKIYREKSLDGFSRKRTRSIVAPGFSVSENVYPSLFALYTDLNRLKNFFPIGCSFQHVTPEVASFLELPYGEHTQKTLELITQKSGPIACRDEMIVKRLKHFNIPAYYSGDLVLFDEDYIGTPFTPPKVVKSVVFTIQHHLHYLEQSITILKAIKLKFPNAKRYIAFHSVPGATAKTIALRAQQFGFEPLHQYGDVENLDRYDDIDLHIGYRLHGHITFLRKRKPSILMVEDARAFGFSRTEGTAHGCIDAYNLKIQDADDTAPARCMEFVDSQLKSGFKEYQNIFDFIDSTYESVICPLFDKIAEATQLEAI